MWLLWFLVGISVWWWARRRSRRYEAERLAQSKAELHEVLLQVQSTLDRMRNAPTVYGELDKRIIADSLAREQRAVAALRYLCDVMHADKKAVDELVAVIEGKEPGDLPG